MPTDTLQVNRAPVLALWGAVVASRSGYDWDAALTLGRAVSGLNAQSKGRRIGVFGPPKAPERGGPPKKTGLGEDHWVEVCGRPVPALHTGDGVRAVVKDKAIDPRQVEAYLQKAFGEGLEAVRQAMDELAASLSEEDLRARAYALYTEFRPTIEAGKRGWGQKGELRLDTLRKLAQART